MWWALSEEVLNQVRGWILNAAFNFSCVCNFLCIPVLRQVCDLREPQGQLGTWCHRPKQRDVGHVGNHQGTGQDGQTRWGESSSHCKKWLSDSCDYKNQFISVLVCGRKMEASQVHHLWELGSWRVRPYWVRGVRRGDFHLTPTKTGKNSKDCAN